MMMMVRNALALLALVTLAGGCGRSKMVLPPHGIVDAAVVAHWPDTGVLPPDVAVKDASPPPSDGPTTPDLAPIRPDVLGSPDGLPPADAAKDLLAPDLASDGPPPVPPDTQPDGLRPIPDTLPPILPDAIPPPDGRLPPPDGTPPPDLMPPSDTTAPPDLVPPPDTRPAQSCVAGGACSADCTTTCGTFGFMACACTSGTLTCTTCQVLPITVSPDPCPASPTGKDCTSDGVACIAFTNGSISGACICTVALDGVDRWTCILR